MSAQPCRQNEELERAFQEEKAKLEREAHALAEQLQAVLSKEYVPQTDFDADTPIDKTLKILQTIIGVRVCPPCRRSNCWVFPCLSVYLSVCLSVLCSSHRCCKKLSGQMFGTAAFQACCLFLGSFA